jgi:SAM-dependent methyltransferase
LTRTIGSIIALGVRGDRVECPRCDAKLRRFIEYPSLYCPRCGSYERHRLLALQLRARPRLLAPPIKLLQVSPDRPLERLVTRAGIERVSVDVDNPQVELEMDVRELTFEDGSFDVALALHVLCVVDERERALSELHRVLDDGGRAILQVPLDDQPRLLAELDTAGFETETLVASDLGPEAVVRHGLIAAEETLVARKR